MPATNDEIEILSCFSLDVWDSIILKDLPDLFECVALMFFNRKMTLQQLSLWNVLIFIMPLTPVEKLGIYLTALISVVSLNNTK